MINGNLGKIIAAVTVPVAWLASFEWRLRSKVDHKHCTAVSGPIQQQMTRIESHLWDIMKAQKLEPTMPPPDEIRNNHR